MAQALKEGNLGVMDYYNLLNVQSDTQMRESIAKVGQKAPVVEEVTPEGGK